MKGRKVLLILILPLLSNGCAYVLAGVWGYALYKGIESSAKENRRLKRLAAENTSPGQTCPKEEKQPRGLDAYNDGIKSYEDCDFEKALTHFEKAISSGDLPDKERATTHFYRGAIFVLLNEKDRAKDEFRQCKSICPDYSPSREIFRPDVIALYEACPKN